MAICSVAIIKVAYDLDVDVVWQAICHSLARHTSLIRKMDHFQSWKPPPRNRQILPHVRGEKSMACWLGHAKTACVYEYHVGYHLLFAYST